MWRCFKIWEDLPSPLQFRVSNGWAEEGLIPKEKSSLPTVNTFGNHNGPGSPSATKMSTLFSALPVGFVDFVITKSVVLNFCASEWWRQYGSKFALVQEQLPIKSMVSYNTALRNCLQYKNHNFMPSKDTIYQLGMKMSAMSNCLLPDNDGVKLSPLPS